MEKGPHEEAFWFVFILHYRSRRARCDSHFFGTARPPSLSSFSETAPLLSSLLPFFSYVREACQRNHVTTTAVQKCSGGLRTGRNSSEHTYPAYTRVGFVCLNLPSRTSLSPLSCSKKRTCFYSSSLSLRASRLGHETPSYGAEPK